MSATPSISVIIVTYNSAGVIGYCLESLDSQTVTDIEIIIVDNDSEDDIANAVNGYGVTLVKNYSNAGFAKACHQGVESAVGEIFLFTNPDTIHSPDICERIIEEIEGGDNIGAVSPILIDGLGKYLPETARRIPTPSAAFKHILNLSSTSYYQELEEAKINGIDVACGACLAVRKDVWVEVGGFDTRYFMYAEDVDLSYQLKKHGFRIALLNDIHTIHLKGESTEKKGWKYNRHFYHSMNLFVHKYHGELFSHLQSALSSFLTLSLSIFSFLFGFIKSLFVPIVHVALFVLVLCAFEHLWAAYYHGDNGYYGGINTFLQYLKYSLIWVACIGATGGYLSSVSKYSHQLQGYVLGWFISILIYSLLPESIRFSRAILVMGGVFIALIFYLLKLLLENENSQLSAHVVTRKQKAAKDKFKRLFPMITLSGWNDEIKEPDSSGTIIFDVDATYQDFSLPSVLHSLAPQSTGYYNEKRQSILMAGLPGTKSIETNACSFHNLGKETYRFQKELLDKFFAILLLPLAVIVKSTKMGRVMSSVRNLLTGKMTLIGLPQRGDLSKTVRSVISLERLVDTHTLEDPLLSYSVHYTIFADVGLVIKNLPSILNGLAGEYD